MLDVEMKMIRFRHHEDSHKHHHEHRHGGGVESKTTAGREIKVLRRVLDVNEEMARRNRAIFSGKGIFVLNMMSSPGSGKTTTLEKTLNLLRDELKCAVIVGDICTTNDADRLARAGVPVVQINTDEFGGDCHLTAHVIQTAFDGIDSDNLDLLVVENIGNLVCPAEFDIGEDARAVVLSVTEGEDKPLKYPLMFRESDVALLNKVDLLPYLDFDVAAAEGHIRQIHPQMPIFRLSAKTGEGFDIWIDWIRKSVAAKKSAHPASQ
ncbi:MAG: hydrogenase nickel incorporation protein HypB [Thermodesulfobacteriota bacterium]